MTRFAARLTLEGLWTIEYGELEEAKGLLPHQIEALKIAIDALVQMEKLAGTLKEILNAR